MTTVDELRNVDISAQELKRLTGWEDAVIEAFLSFQDTNLDFSQEIDDLIDKINNLKIETIPTSAVSGSIPFAESGFLTFDNPNLFYDNVNNRLGVGTNTPVYRLEVSPSMKIKTGTAPYPNDGVIIESLFLSGLGVNAPSIGSFGLGGLTRAVANRAGLFLIQNTGDFIAPTPTINFTDPNATSSTQGQIKYDPSTEIMDFSTVTLRLAQDESDGRLGVGLSGTDTPLAATHVKKTGFGIPILLMESDVPDDCSFALQCGTLGIDNIVFGTDVSETNSPFVITSTTGKTISTSDYRLVMDRDNGNFALGKTPTIPVGNFEFVQDDDCFVDIIGDSDNDDTDTIAGIRVFINGQSGSGTQKVFLGYHETDGLIKFSRNESLEDIVISSQGAIGIGTDDLETWFPSVAALQIGGTGALWSTRAQVAGAEVYYGQNVYRSIADRYIIADEATEYLQKNGEHLFRVAPSGTANSNISWVDALLIDNSGLLTLYEDRIIIAQSHTPSSASDTGTTGSIAWDSDYIYVCTATDTWKRTAISTW